MLRLAVLSGRGRISTFAGALVALIASSALVVAGGMPFEAALRTQPPADVSAMDGYAARASDVAKVPVELRVIGGALLKPDQGGKQLPLGDGVDQNDKPFRTSFPYVALPDSGFDTHFGRVEPAHAPVPQPPA